MTAHIFHDDTHTHGLADNCPRCEELAINFPYGWDDINMSNLVHNTRKWRAGEFLPRSANERKAMDAVDRHLRIMERVTPHL
jgi:hypothetical protein